MAISDSTANTMSDWYTKSLAGTTGTTTPTATANTGSAFGGTTPKATSTGPNVADWYKQVAGREGEQAGIDHWNNILASGADASQVYKDFVKSAVDNNDYNPTGSASGTQGPSLIDLNSLKNRDVTKEQTVAGQLGGLLDANSNYIQSARDRAQRAANARGLSNSSIAASAGEDSAYQAALPIATSDATVNRDVSAYNAALYNQGLMYNTDAQNTFAQQANQIAADRASQQSTLGSQMSIAQLQAATAKYQADKNELTSKYNTDAATKQQADQNKNTLVNNIIQTPDLSPDRKAELLKQLGEPGLASAIYVANDIASDLRGSGWSGDLAPAADVINGG